MNTIRRVAIVGGNRIPFVRSNTAYARASNQDMLTAALDGLVARYGLQGERLGEVAAGADTGDDCVEALGKVGEDFLCRGLHVHVDVGVADRAQNLVGDAGTVGHAEDGDLGFVAVESDA